MNDVPFVLPTFRGFTVDVRLKEFCLAARDKGLEFIPFDSKKGRELLDEMRRYFLFLYQGLV
ncbi:hypothetical protein KAR91_27225 [Candidatus Pacearchaeota archaeon]|nr:hypothetical protein [Candidatus Pacearchaeota archaeon]